MKNYIEVISDQVVAVIEEYTSNLAAQMFTRKGIYIAVNGSVILYDGYMRMDDDLYVSASAKNINRYLRDAEYKGEL